MSLVKKVISLALLVLSACAATFALGFLLGDTFFPGGLPTLVVSEFPHVWLPAAIVFALVCVIWFRLHKTKPAKLAAILAVVTLAASGLGIYQMIEGLNTYGEAVDLLSSGKSYDVSNIKTDDQVFMQGVKGPLELTVYYSEDGKTDKPVIVYTHGGGWIHNNRFERNNDCKVLALAGFVVVSWDYDLSTSELHLWDKVEPEAIEAITWVRDNVANYGGSTERFYMIGDSAGGQLTLNVSNKINAGIYTATDGSALPTVDAVCCNYPVASPTAFWSYDGDLLLTSTLAQGKMMVEYYIGGTPEEQPERAAWLEPVLYVTENTPPTVFIVPEADSLVPPQASYDYIDYLKSRGISATAITVPHANHGFDYVIGNVGDQAFLTYIVGWFNMN